VALHFPDLPYQNLATFSITRGADITVAVDQLLVMEETLHGFENVRDSPGKALTPLGYIRSLIFNMQWSLAEEGGGRKTR
jgi:hypothetical protein